MLDVALGAQAVADLVARPREAAHAEFFAGLRELQARLEIAGFEEALDHGVAVENTPSPVCRAAAAASGTAPLRAAWARERRR
jgi:hypothetical protein